MQITINSQTTHDIHHVVCDFNGTIAVDGEIIAGVRELFAELKFTGLTVHVVTADTHGNAAAQLQGYACELKIIGEDMQDIAKLAFINNLDAAQVCAIGNGQNDRLILKEAAIGIAVMQDEGCAWAAWMAADLVVKNIHDALTLILKPLRLKATLRV